MVRVAALLLLTFTAGLTLAGPSARAYDIRLSPDDRVTQVKDTADVALAEVRKLIRLAEAVQKFGERGARCTVAVLDTGINPAHVDFGKRIVAQRNYTEDNHKKPDDARDGNGHGTHVAGIIAANGTSKGIAPEARIIAMKVLDNEGGGSFDDVRAALRWILENHQQHTVCAANLSLGDDSNLSSLTAAEAGEMGELIVQLRAAGVPMVVSAGNAYFQHKTAGMSFPAIIPQTVSVGAVYDGRLGDKPIQYQSGAIAFATAADRVTPFSQRLPEDIGGHFRTDVFGPGAAVTSTGARNATEKSTSSGTSQAAPAVAGVVLLAQSYWLSKRKELPPVDSIEKWLRAGTTVKDGDDEEDNVLHTNATFVRVDALAALEAAHKDLASLPH